MAPLLQKKVDLNKVYPQAKYLFSDHTKNFKVFNYNELMHLGKAVLNLFPDVSTLIEHEPDPQTINMVLTFDGTYTVYKEHVLKSGETTFSLNNWNKLKFQFNGNKITAFLNGQQLTEVTDDTYSKGMAGFGCGWHIAYFDNLAITK
jgi:hypothetical protein